MSDLPSIPTGLHPRKRQNSTRNQMQTRRHDRKVLQPHLPSPRSLHSRDSRDPLECCSNWPLAGVAGCSWIPSAFANHRGSVAKYACFQTTCKLHKLNMPNRCSSSNMRLFSKSLTSQAYRSGRDTKRNDDTSSKRFGNRMYTVGGATQLFAFRLNTGKSLVG